MFCLLTGGLAREAYGQNFPSIARPSASLSENFLSDGEYFMSPTLSLGTSVEFRHIYALNIAFSGSFLSGNDRVLPLLGFNYDIYFKLFRSDPPARLIPALGIRLGKQWQIRRARTETEDRMLADASDWRFQALAGLDLVPFGTSHLKIMGGINVLIGPREFYKNAVSPCLMLMGEL